MKKTCAKCRTEKPLGDFHRDSGRADGRYAYCKSCVGAFKIPCKSCKEAQIVENFYPGRKTCKDCDIAEGVKWCSGCHNMKPLDAFFIDRKRKSGRYVLCKGCCRNQDRVSGTNKWRVAARYGMTLPEHEAMLAQQGGVCSICGKPEWRKRKGKVLALHVDHCHVSEQVRGLLCADCNLGLGRFMDDPKRLRRAAEYLDNAKKVGVASCGNGRGSTRRARNRLQH